MRVVDDQGAQCSDIGGRAHFHEQMRHPLVVVEQHRERPAIARQLRFARQSGEEDFLLALVMECAGVKMKKGEKGRKLLEGGLASDEPVGPGAERAQHALDPRVLFLKIVKELHQGQSRSAPAEAV